LGEREKQRGKQNVRESNVLKRVENSQGGLQCQEKGKGKNTKKKDHPKSGGGVTKNQGSLAGAGVGGSKRIGKGGGSSRAGKKENRKGPRSRWKGEGGRGGGVKSWKNFLPNSKIKPIMKRWGSQGLGGVLKMLMTIGNQKKELARGSSVGGVTSLQGERKKTGNRSKLVPVPGKRG